MAVQEQKMICPNCGSRRTFTWSGAKPQNPTCGRCRTRMESDSPIMPKQNRNYTVEKEQEMICPSCGSRQIFTWSGEKPQHPTCGSCRTRMKSDSPIRPKQNRNRDWRQNFKCPSCNWETTVEWDGQKPPNPTCSRCRARMKSSSPIGTGRHRGR